MSQYNFGDPCIYCGVPHDEVAPGECRGPRLKLGTLVRFAHERNGGPVHRVVSVMQDGMVELHDMGGYFAPHLFQVADDIGGIPPDPPLSELARLQAAVAYCRMRLKRGAYRDTLDAILRGDKDDQIRNPDLTPAVLS